MRVLCRALCLIVLAAPGCAPPHPAEVAAPAATDVLLQSPSGFRTGIVEQSIDESRERECDRRFIRDLQRSRRAGEDAR